MACGLWDLQKDIQEWDKIPASDSEDEDVISSQTNTEKAIRHLTEINNTNLELCYEVENRIKLYGSKLCTENYKLLTTLSEKISTRHMALLTELIDCDYSSFNDKIVHEFGKKNSYYMSLLEAGLQCIRQINPERITWKNILTALMKIPEWSTIKSLLQPELDEYWTKLNEKNKVKDPISCTKQSVLSGSIIKTKEPVESLELDTKLENVGILNNHSVTESPSNNLEDSGIDSSPCLREEAMFDSFSNLAINTSKNSSGISSNLNHVELGMQSTENGPLSPPAAVFQNQCTESTISSACTASQQQQQQLPSYTNQTNFSVTAQQPCFFMNGMPSMIPSPGQHFNSIPFPSLPLQMSFPAQPWPIMPFYPLPINNALNNTIQNSFQNNENCLQPRCNNYPISEGCSSSLSQQENGEIKVLITYSNDADRIALELQARLYTEYSILAMTQKDLQNRMQHSLGNDVVNRCNMVKYVVPILSKKYINDIGYGHLLGINCNLSYNDQDLEDKNLVSSIYSQYINMCFANGGRNDKVRPVCVMNNSFSIRSKLVPCLSNAWHLWDDLKVFATVILRC